MEITESLDFERSVVERLRRPEWSGFGLYAQPPTATWPSLSFRPEYLYVTRDREAYELIRYESDPQRSTSYNSYNIALKQLRARRKRLYAQISKSEYESLVQRWTSPFPKYISVWDGTYWVSREWNLQWWRGTKFFETLSKREYLEELVRSVPNLTNMLEVLQTIEQLKQHPEWDVPNYRLNVRLPGQLSIRSTAGDAIWKYLNPSMVRKEIPNRDWAKIRDQWHQRRMRVQEQIDEVEAAIEIAQRDRDRHSIHLKLPYNRMIYRRDGDPLDYSGAYPCPTLVGSVKPHGMFGDWVEGRSVLDTDSAFNPLPFYRVSGSLERWTFTTKQTNSPPMAVESLRCPDLVFENWVDQTPGYRWSSPDDVVSWAAILKSLVQSYRLIQIRGQMSDGTWISRTVDADNFFDPGSGILSGPLMVEDIGIPSYMKTARPYCIDLDKEEGLDIEARFEDARKLAIGQLLALDINSHQATFNLARSVGELKDSKDTIKSGRDFWDYIRASRGETYYVVTPLGSHKSQRILSRNSILGSRVDHLFSTGARTKRALSKLGLARAVQKVVTPATTIAHLASLYLAWKFGVSQTIGDVDTVLTNGWRWATTVRRGLSQLVTHLDRAKELIPLRRMWRVRSTKLPKSNQRTQYVERIRDRTTGHLVLHDVLDFSPILDCYTNPARWNTLEAFNDDGECRVITSFLGFKYAFFTDRVREHTRQALKEYNRGVFLNLLEINALGVGPCLAIRNELRGVVFARFSWRGILKALRGGSKNLHAQLKTLLTAWELTPLSFVVEWLTNVRDLITKAQSLIERTEMKVAPVGKPWECLSAQLWTGEIAAGLDVTMRLEAATWQYLSAHNDYRYLLSSGKEQCERFITTAMAVKEARISYTFDRKIAAQAITMKRSQIKRAVRRPYLGDYDELPEVRMRLNLNASKLGSLLAMLTQSWR